MNYVKMILQLLGALTLNVQGGNADFQSTKVGVCNYRSKSDLLEDAPQDILRRNVDYYRDKIIRAGSENAKIVIFPEGGLTTLMPFHKNRDVYFKYSLDMADWKDSCPCDDDIWYKKGKKGYVIRTLSCTAKSNQVYVVVNILEKEFINGEAYPYDIYNTNLVFNNSGYIIVRYRKTIPGVTTGTEEIKDENEFTVSNRKYKTIIGNDIYNEHYNFITTDNNISIIWSTASKKNCTDLPAIALAQIFGKKNESIYIADYGDDLWSSSCSYYHGNLYTSFGDQSADHLILVPSDAFNMKRQELKANCFIKYILNHVNSTSLVEGVDEKEYETCKISYNMNTNNNYSSIFIVSTKDRKEISLCGIAAGSKDADDLDYSSIHEGKFNNLTISWYKEEYDCNRNEYYIPITAATNYWPLKIDEYIFIPGPPGKLSLNGTDLAIFALMRVRDMIENCTKIGQNNMSTENNSLSPVIRIVLVIVGIVVIVVILGLGLLCYLKIKAPKIGQPANPQESLMMNQK